MSERSKWLIVEVAALGWDLVHRHGAFGAKWNFQPIEPVFPAVTCSAQAAFRTASAAAVHDMPGNGYLDRTLRRVFFWEQSAALVRGVRIWDAARSSGRRVALLFWQQSLGESTDVVLSPKPIHKHHGGMIQDCYSQPEDLYERLCRKIGRPFDLMRYWGPLASLKSSEWIAEATMATMEDASLELDIVFSYLPHLDYDLQRFGPESAQAVRAAQAIASLMDRLREFAERRGWQWVFWGDYAMESVRRGAVFPQRALREAGLFQVRRVRGRAYPDLYASRAVAVTDHQIAHVYVGDTAALEAARNILGCTEGVAQCLGREEQRAQGVDAPRGGDLMLVAEPGRWFAYPWWTERCEEPDYASHVDIHNKPGYDPCELFFGWPPGAISRDTSRVRGTHGRVGGGLNVAWASSADFEPTPRSLPELAAALAKKL